MKSKFTVPQALLKHFESGNQQAAFTASKYINSNRLIDTNVLSLKYVKFESIYFVQHIKLKIIAVRASFMQQYITHMIARILFRRCRIYVNIK